jgi:hypothetical protein
MTARARLTLLLLGCLAVWGASDLPAQGRPKEVECSSLLFSGCRNYVIEVVRVEPGGSERPQPPSDTYLSVDPDTLSPSAYLVLKLYDGDGLKGGRSVIWVERVVGLVGGDWPSTLKNDAARSAELVGVPGDVVELYDDRGKGVARGMTRLVILAGKESCKTPGSLDRTAGSGCAVKEGPTVAGKVSGMVIKYRAASPSAPDTLPAPGAAPDSATPADTLPAPAAPPKPSAPADTLPRSEGPPPADAVPQAVAAPHGEPLRAGPSPLGRSLCAGGLAASWRSCRGVPAVLEWNSRGRLAQLVRARA